MQSTATCSCRTSQHVVTWHVVCWSVKHCTLQMQSHAGALRLPQQDLVQKGSQVGLYLTLTADALCIMNECMNKQHLTGQLLQILFIVSLSISSKHACGKTQSGQRCCMPQADCGILPRTIVDPSTTVTGNLQHLGGKEQQIPGRRIVSLLSAFRCLGVFNLIQDLLFNVSNAPVFLGNVPLPNMYERLQRHQFLVQLPAPNLNY